MRLLLILVLGSLMHAVGSFGPKPDLVGGTSGTALAIGYLLLSAFFAGSIFKSIGLPKLTGYIITGIIVGPKVLGLGFRSRGGESHNFQWSGGSSDCPDGRGRTGPGGDAVIDAHYQVADLPGHFRHHCSSVGNCLPGPRHVAIHAGTHYQCRLWL